MSVYAIVWAYEQDVDNHGAKFTLVTAAQYANEDGVCWVSQETLAEDMSMGVSTVRRHLAHLEDNLQMIKRHERRRKDGTRSSDMIELLGFKKNNRSNRAPDESSTAQIEHSNRSNRAGRNVSKELTNVRSSGKPQKRRGKPKDQDKPIPLEQHVTSQIYDCMKERGYRWVGDEYGYHLGRVKDVLAKDNPSDQELEDLPEFLVDYYQNWNPRADAVSALREMRRTRQRKERPPLKAVPNLPQKTYKELN